MSFVVWGLETKPFLIFHLLFLSCRFDFPKPPSEKTLIARPPPDDMPDDELEKLKGIGKKIKDKLNEIEPEEEDMSGIAEDMEYWLQLTHEDLKKECRERNLHVSGSKPV